MNETSFTSWLLQAETPSIRYRTLVDLLGLPASDPQVRQAQQAIMQNGPVPAILAGQSEGGNWSGERSYYTPKYTSTHWSLTLLAELDVDGSDPRFHWGVQYMLNTTADELEALRKARTPGWSCFWGNMLRYACQSGVSSGALLEGLISHAVLELDNGPCLCEHNGGKPCAWGLVRSLWGLSALPDGQRSPELRRLVDQGLTFLLDTHRLVEARYPSWNEAVLNPLWFKLNFPLFYQADILFTLRVLDELDMLAHPDAGPALDWLERLRGRNGRWNGSSPYRQRTWRELGSRLETDRWVSLQAARILRHAGRISG